MFAHSWASAVFGLVTFAVMARILGPEPYGIMALAALVFGVAGVFVGAPLTESIQQRDEITNVHLDTTFWLNSGLTLLFAVVIALLAEPISALIGAPAVAEVLPALSVIMLFSSLEGVPGALLQRELENDKLVWIETASELLTTGLALVLALLGFGVWSLVISMAAGTLISVAGCFYASKWRPGFSVSVTAFRELFAFNRDTVGTYLPGLCGRCHPAFPVEPRRGRTGRRPAVYRGYNLRKPDRSPDGAVQRNRDECGCASAVQSEDSSRIARPRIRNDDRSDLSSDIGAGYCVATLDSARYRGRVDSGGGTVADFPIVLGIRDATGTFNIAILRGVGDSRSPLIILSLRILFLLILAPLLLPYGVAGIATLIALRTFLTWPVSAWLVQKAAGYSAIRQIVIGWRALIASLGMVAIVLLVNFHMPTHWSEIARVAVMIISGILSYTGLMFMVGAGQVREIREGIGWFRDHHDDAVEPA